jgi:hypothetical protein
MVYSWSRSFSGTPHTLQFLTEFVWEQDFGKTGVRDRLSFSDLPDNN